MNPDSCSCGDTFEASTSVGAKAPRGCLHQLRYIGATGFVLWLAGITGTAAAATAFSADQANVPWNVPRHVHQTGPQTGAVAFGSPALALRRRQEQRRASAEVVSRRREDRVVPRGFGEDSRRIVVSTAVAAATATDMEEADAFKIIDGKATAAAIRAELKGEVAAHCESTRGVPPGLAVVLVGGRRDSATYVRMKKKACEEIGVSSFGFDFAEDVTQDALLACVGELNARVDVHGILVQLPLPKHIDEQVILESILPSKDVDGLHPENVAALCSGRTREGKAISWALKDLDFHVPCTPQGCIELLDRYGVQISGKRAVVIGRSNIVGIPVSMLLMHRDATVTMAHSKTRDIGSVVRDADILVCAAGRAEMVKADWIKPGAAVIDVGINSVDDPSSKKGYRLVGDVDFKAVKEVAAKITPVPGGVGPMTIAMLLRNTVNGAVRMHAAGLKATPLPVPPVQSSEGASAATA